ncbi:6-phosphogluconolactonase [Candidatus Aerophobetes bacterium]|uniref:6-phosphogluconolactonase n=1 Tax=Aerophobetes bacterium TaxID=2030807 RepID=A0A2A4WWT4_UNCAE|nr:MAG: 6-phosphogluconolactonase [Candidatus Aerophobetes bacterium]
MTHTLPHFFTSKNGQDVAVIGDYEKTIEYATEHFIQTAKAAITNQGSFFVALSGGSTPNAIYKNLSSSKSSEIDWSKVFFFWSDERAVSPTNSESNFFNSMNAGIKKLPLVKKQVFRMHAEADIEANAALYEKIIKEHLGLRPFDLIMLGMGDDGHTASLFPQTKALEESSKWVVANEVAQKKVWRMTMTYPCINRAKNIVVYILGSAKKTVINKVLFKKNSPPFPIEKIGTDNNKALFILDIEASAVFRKNLSD